MVGGRKKMIDYSESYEPEVCYLIKKEGSRVCGWDSWKKISECSPEEISQANIVKVGYTELVLDVDSEEKLSPCLEKLDQEGFSYEVWNSGSPGHYHIHSNFEELKWLNPVANEKGKELLIAKFIPSDSQALAKASNRTCIARKDKPHFKLENEGRVKSLIRKVDKGVNILPGSFFIELVNSLVSDTHTLVGVDSVEVVGSVGKSYLRSAEIISLFGDSPKVFEHFRKLGGDVRPVDRSASDFVLVKFLVERNVSYESIYNFLKLLRWSKCREGGRSYFDFTYKNVLRRCQE